MKTQQEALDWILKQEGETLPFWGYSQCVAFVRNYIQFLGYKQPQGVPGAKDLWPLSWGPEFIKVTNPLPGDIGILKASAKNPDGHINIVIEQSADRLVTMDQNLVNPQLGGTQGSPIHKTSWPFPNDRYLGFIRPQFKSLAPKEREMDVQVKVIDPDDYRVNDGDIKNICREDGWEPSAGYIKAWIGQPWHDFIYDWQKQPVRKESLSKKYSTDTDGQRWREFKKLLNS